MIERVHSLRINTLSFVIASIVHVQSVYSTCTWSEDLNMKNMKKNLHVNQFHLQQRNPYNEQLTTCLPLIVSVLLKTLFDVLACDSHSLNQGFFSIRVNELPRHSIMSVIFPKHFISFTETTESTYNPISTFDTSFVVHKSRVFRSSNTNWQQVIHC